MILVYRTISIAQLNLKHQYNFWYRVFNDSLFIQILFLRVTFLFVCFFFLEKSNTNLNFKFTLSHVLYTDLQYINIYQNAKLYNNLLDKLYCLIISTNYYNI